MECGAIVDELADYMLMNSFVNDIDRVFLGYCFLDRGKGNSGAPMMKQTSRTALFEKKPPRAWRRGFS